MNCLKCGRETGETDVFCQDCLLEMEKYPVDPGTVVFLPRKRESFVSKKTVKRHTASSEEQLSTLRQQYRLLLLFLLVCLVAILMMFKPAMHYIRDEHYEIGQNYSTVINTPAPTE